MTADLGYVEQPSALPEAFRCTWVRRGAVPGGASATVLPDACSDIVVDTSGTAVVVGPTMTPHRLAVDPSVTFHGLRLQPWSIPMLFRTTAAALRDRVLPLDALLDARTARQVAAEVWAGRLPACWRTLDTSPWQLELVRSMLHAPSRGVERAGRAVGLSERQARRTTRELTGLSPRELAHVGRLHRLLPLIGSGGVPLASIAAQVGYSDQAHMTRDLRSLAGGDASLAADRAQRPGQLACGSVRPLGGGPADVRTGPGRIVQEAAAHRLRR